MANSVLIDLIPWRNQVNQNHQERGESQIPVQEIGDREKQEKRIVQGDTVKRTKIPLEQDDL